MVFGPNTVASLTYELFVITESGEDELYEEVTKDEAYNMLFEDEEVLPPFKAMLTNKSKGEAFELQLSAEQAYGDIDGEQIEDIPLDVVYAGDEDWSKNLILGDPIVLSDENDDLLEGIILDVNDDYIRVDFNHPLAGSDIKFVGKILDIRAATDEEKEQGFANA